MCVCRRVCNLSGVDVTESKATYLEGEHTTMAVLQVRRHTDSNVFAHVDWRWPSFHEATVCLTKAAQKDVSLRGFKLPRVRQHKRRGSRPDQDDVARGG